MKFTDYSDISLRAFEFTDKKTEVMTRKRDIVDSVLTHHSISPRSTTRGQMEASFLRMTRPITSAEGWIYAVGWIFGVASWNFRST